MGTLKEALEGLDLQALLAFYANNDTCLHISRYHKESFPEHCFLVISKMIKKYNEGEVSRNAVLAACLHDIAKPRTAKLNKRGDACFYGHENVTDEDLAEFLDPSYPGFPKVAALIRAHMLPLNAANQFADEKSREGYRKKLDAVLDAQDEQFRKDLFALSECDQAGSVRDDADLPKARETVAEVKALLKALL